VKGNPNDKREIERPSKFYIFDARGALAVTGNKFTGKGSEVSSNYVNTSLVFCNIENIHHMRDSITSLTDLLLQTSNNGL